MPNGKYGVYGYFIKDHQGSTREVLTEEQHTRWDLCSMETNGQQPYEEAEFGNATNNEVAARVLTLNSQTGVDNWSSNPSQYVSKLGGPGNANKIGPNKLLKVMAGDDLQMGVNYYVHSSPNSQQSNNSITQTVASLLANLLTGTTATSGSHSFAGTVGSSSGSSYAGINSFLTTDRTYPHSSLPKAYLNYVFFDENFNYIPYDGTTGLGSYGVQIETEGDAMNVLTAQAKAPKNGYAFVYISNESDAQTVYFDNLAVVHTRSKLLEEATTPCPGKCIYLPE